MDEILLVFGVIQAEPLILLSMNNLTTTGIPIWNSFMCSQNLTGITVETLKRGINIGNGTETTDKVTLLSDLYISTTNTNSLTTGDWTLTTGTWPCYVFNNFNRDYKFISGIVDQLIITAYVNGNQSRDTGIIFGIFDDIRPINVVEPFTAEIPSINTYTFTLTERVDVNNKEYSYFTVNKQNYHPITFQNNSVAARFLYSPDTYLAVKYVEKPQYTIYDIISATGGNLTYAIALWIILFGRGKYKSWGLVQRFILRNSPDNEGLDLESQIELSAFSLRRPVPSHQPQLQQQQHSHHLEPDSATSTFYRKSATPITFENIDSMGELTDKEITKKINKIVDEKLWFLEQTISRHYLSGFRLRRFDSDLRKLKHKNGFCDDDVKRNIKNDNLKNNSEDENKHQHNYDDEIKPSKRRLSL
ncbi:2957_t:CDS:2 [Diversispora eburnea]|uniref:2957_t:CDS:1 n=1 Tax=Diversispora eburnea TaxID=1213867 RepID=A0A9N9AFR8_9GLOM|nr:2957_t:CDS:2 [Diversispora eburnea]